MGRAPKSLTGEKTGAPIAVSRKYIFLKLKII